MRAEGETSAIKFLVSSISSEEGGACWRMACLFLLLAKSNSHSVILLRWYTLNKQWGANHFFKLSKHSFTNSGHKSTSERRPNQVEGSVKNGPHWIWDVNAAFYFMPGSRVLRHCIAMHHDVSWVQSQFSAAFCRSATPCSADGRGLLQIIPAAFYFSPIWWTFSALSFVADEKRTTMMTLQLMKRSL